MERRNALKGLAATLGATVATPTLITLLQACEQPQQEELWQPMVLTEEQGKTLRAMVDRIIPKTETPGAKEAGVHQFIDLILKDCTPQEEVLKFTTGLDELDQKCVTKYKSRFIELEEAKQDEFLNAENDALAIAEELPFFGRLKDSTIWAFYTSELGAKTLAYLPIPGDYNACMELTPEQKTWAI